MDDGDSDLCASVYARDSIGSCEPIDEPMTDLLTTDERVEVEHLRAWCAKHPDDRSLPVILGALDRLAPVQR